jgi:hypothetical protein
MHELLHLSMMLHLALRTYYSHSSSATHPPITKPTPFDRGHPNAVVWAEFRDLYPGRRDIFELAVVADPINFVKDVKDDD